MLSQKERSSSPRTGDGTHQPTLGHYPLPEWQPRARIFWGQHHPFRAGLGSAPLKLHDSWEGEKQLSTGKLEWNMGQSQTHNISLSWFHALTHSFPWLFLGFSLFLSYKLCIPDPCARKPFSPGLSPLNYWESLFSFSFPIQSTNICFINKELKVICWQQGGI